MAAKTVGFAIADEDRALLEELVEYFSPGNRSEFLRLAMERMAREKFSQRMVKIQAMVRADLAGRVLTEAEVAEAVRAAKGKE